MNLVTHKYYVITFGCQMNKNDSERIESLFRTMEMAPTDRPEEADVILLNSCSVRQTAEDRIYGLTTKFAKWKESRPELIVCVTGCMPGRDKNGKMRAKMPGVDLFFPTKDVVHLPKWLGELNSKFRFTEDVGKDYLTLRPAYQKKFQAFVTLQTGCNHFCTYCVVPFSRGLEANRPLKDILEETRTLAENECLEVTLLGQIVNHYVAPDPEHFSAQNPYDKSDFAKLLWELNQIHGIERIHWTAPHPIYMTDEVIDALTLPKQVNYIHLPVQSGNTDVLRRMNRRHTREFYLETIKKIRGKRPDMAIGTDIIVGFCGETEAQFLDTVSLYTACDFDISYHAQYSSRTGTVASRAFIDDVAKSEKKRRWQVLQDLMEETTHRKNQRYVGTNVSVLVESYGGGFCQGNSREMKLVRLKGDESLVGRIIEAEVYKADTWILWARFRDDICTAGKS